LTKRAYATPALTTLELQLVPIAPKTMLSRDSTMTLLFSKFMTATAVSFKCTHGFTAYWTGTLDALDYPHVFSRNSFPPAVAQPLDNDIASCADVFPRG
jgi:hypothetical protein